MAEAVSIAIAVAADREELFALFGDWDRSYAFDEGDFRDSFARILADGENRVLVARLGGRIVGFLQCFPCVELGLKPYLEIAELLVAEGKRSRGVGKALLAAAEARSRELGLHVVKLHSQTHRDRAHAFYEREGYVRFKSSHFYEKSMPRV